MRGVALASGGDVEAARNEGRAIVAIEENADFGSMIAGGVPAPDILRLAQHVVAARIARAEGDLETAATQFELAIAVEDSLPYLEPPYWYYPVRQSLGAVLLAAGKPVEAERAFQQSLVRTPNNGWALYGLREAQKAQGEAVAAQLTERLFKRAWAGDQADLDLARL
jgi:tetratricopeptide (TPR) repeat protein